MPRRSGKFYINNEKQVMKKLGLNPTRGSGSGWIEKEDGQNDYIIAQLKSTDARSISIKKEDLETLEYNADVTHKRPLFIIEFLQTDELYFLIRPSDIVSIARYIQTGLKEEANKVIEDILETRVRGKKKIASGNRGEFWEEKEREWESGSKGKGDCKI